MSLIELLQKHDEDDLLRTITEAVLQTLMERDVEGLIGAGAGAEAAAGLLLRGLLEPPRTSEKGAGGLPLSLGPMAFQWLAPGGVDGWRLDAPGRRAGPGDGAHRHLQEHGLEALVRDFLDRPFTGEWPDLWLDATYLKVRQGGRIASRKSPKGRADPTTDRRVVPVLPPSRPDLNPIELAFLKHKALIRKAAARTCDPLWAATGHLCDLFTEQECFNHFNAAGYDTD